MEKDYASICRTTQQSIERDRCRATEYTAAADEKQQLLDALMSCIDEKDEWKQKYNDEHQKRIVAEEDLAAERARPYYYIENPKIEELILGDKNIKTYAENNSLEGLPNQRISIGQ